MGLTKYSFDTPHLFFKDTTTMSHTKEYTTPPDANTQWYSQRIEELVKFLTPERYETLKETLKSRTRYMTILTENTFHPQNASALVRHCEAFGVQDIHTVENLCHFTPNINIVKGSDRWIDITRYQSTADALKKLKSDGYRIIATTPHDQDCTPESFDVTKGKFALVFGTEKQGISDEVRAEADEFLRIPMCGMVESLNVSACAAILIYITSSKIRNSDVKWKFNQEEHIEMLYRWVKESVKGADGILERRFGTEK